jgi:hypothetical protein
MSEISKAVFTNDVSTFVSFWFFWCRYRFFRFFWDWMSRINWFFYNNWLTLKFIKVSSIEL